MANSRKVETDMNKNQKGFSVIEILVVIVVIGLIGTVGWLVYDRQKTPKQSTTTQQSATNQDKTSTDKNQTAQINYLTLEDFKVRLPLNDKTSKLKLGQVTSSGYSDSDKSVVILAPELDSFWKCEADADGSKGTIGTISITTQSKRSGPYEPLATKKVGTYTYGFEAGGSNCTDSSSFKELEASFKTQFEQLQAY